MAEYRMEGISAKGKNRIREHGAVWRVVRNSDQSALLEARDGYRRWWAYDADEDFRCARVLDGAKQRGDCPTQTAGVGDSDGGGHQ